MINETYNNHIHTLTCLNAYLRYSLSSYQHFKSDFFRLISALSNILNEVPTSQCKFLQWKNHTRNLLKNTARKVLPDICYYQKRMWSWSNIWDIQFAKEKMQKICTMWCSFVLSRMILQSHTSQNVCSYFTYLENTENIRESMEQYYMVLCECGKHCWKLSVTDDMFIRQGLSQTGGIMDFCYTAWPNTTTIQQQYKYTILDFC